MKGTSKRVNIRVFGGHNSIGGLAPIVGPFGLSPRQVAARLATETADWYGYKINVILELRPDRSYVIEIQPSVSTMILRASNYVPPDPSKRGYGGGLAKGGYETKRRAPGARRFLYKHEADISFEAVFAIAKQQRLWDRSSAIDFAGTVKEVLGSCHTLDVTVEGYSALSIQRCIKGRHNIRNRNRRRKKKIIATLDNKPQQGQQPQQPQQLQQTQNSEERKSEKGIAARGKLWDRRKVKETGEKEKEKENEKGKEKEGEEGELECPIPLEENVSPFIKDGKPDLTLCKDTYMTPEEIEERRALSTRKMEEVRNP